MPVRNRQGCRVVCGRGMLASQKLPLGTRRHRSFCVLDGPCSDFGLLTSTFDFCLLTSDLTLMNRLSSSRSPYLLQHASNPVDWHEWGEEAFAAAKRDDK